jgi:hypothetical protein
MAERPSTNGALPDLEWQFAQVAPSPFPSGCVQIACTLRLAGASPVPETGAMSYLGGLHRDCR